MDFERFKEIKENFEWGRNQDVINVDFVDIDFLIKTIEAQQELNERLTEVIGDYELTATEYKECEDCNGTGVKGRFGKGIHISLTCGTCDGEGFTSDEQLKIKQLEKELAEAGFEILEKETALKAKDHKIEKLQKELSMVDDVAFQLEGCQKGFKSYREVALKEFQEKDKEIERLKVKVEEAYMIGFEKGVQVSK